MKIDNLIFEPVVSFMQAGNNIQRCKTIYNGITIIWETYFPFNIFKAPIDTFTVDLVLPINTILQNGRMNPDYYTEDGYGMPDFKTLEDAIKFIDSYKNK